MPVPKTSVQHRDARAGERGQILAVGVIVILGLIAMAALVLEGGNAFAQQRSTQNGADAAANAGAVVLAQRLGGATKTDTDVNSAVAAMAAANAMTSWTGVYTDLQGKALDANGAVASTSGLPSAAVGAGSIPNNTQGVAVTATKSFSTILGRALNLNSFDASANATAVTGRLVGGPFLPVIFPVSITDCDGNGTLPPFGQDQWETSDPPTTPGGFPVGQEYIIPLCKTFGGGGGGSGGSFQVLDLDPDKTCEEEVLDPPRIEWTTFPVWVDLDNGNNCAKPIADAVNANRRLEPILIPICDTGAGAGVGCESQGGGSKGQYHVSGVVAFYVDWMYDSNSGNDSHCEEAVSSTSGQPLQNVIGGNGSSSCVQGWFIEFITAGPVGAGTVTNADSIGVQLIR